MIRFSNIILLLTSVVLAIKVAAQSSDNVGTLFLSAKVVNENKRGLESTIYVYKDHKLIDEFQTSRIGKFAYNIPMMDSIALIVHEPGHVSKTLIISTMVHPARAKKDYQFPFFMDLYPIGRIPAHIDLDRPVGKIMYSGGQFIYDTDFTKESNEKLKEFVKERKRFKVRKIED